MWSKLSVGLSMAGDFCGIAALLSLFYLVPVEDMISVEKIEYIYDRLSLHMWFLEMILLIAGVAAAVLGFVGYQSVKEEAVKQAVEKAGQEAQAYLKTASMALEQRVVLKPADESDNTLGSVDHQVQPDPSEREV